MDYSILISLYFIALFIQPYPISLFIKLFIQSVLGLNNLPPPFILKPFSIFIFYDLKPFRIEFAMLSSLLINDYNITILVIKSRISIEVSLDSIPVFIIGYLFTIFYNNFISIRIIPVLFSFKIFFY